MKAASWVGPVTDVRAVPVTFGVARPCSTKHFPAYSFVGQVSSRRLSRKRPPSTLPSPLSVLRADDLFGAASLDPPGDVPQGRVDHRSVAVQEPVVAIDLDQLEPGVGVAGPLPYLVGVRH